LHQAGGERNWPLAAVTEPVRKRHSILGTRTPPNTYLSSELRLYCLEVEGVEHFTRCSLFLFPQPAVLLCPVIQSSVLTSFDVYLAVHFSLLAQRGPIRALQRWTLASSMSYPPRGQEYQSSYPHVGDDPSAVQHRKSPSPSHHDTYPTPSYPPPALPPPSPPSPIQPQPQQQQRVAYPPGQPYSAADLTPLSHSH
jgi:hypothetical protein